MEKMSDEIKKLRKTIFHLLNYANMFALVLDGSMTIKFLNNSLAKALGYETYEDALGKCWIDYIIPEEKKSIITIHSAISEGIKWKDYTEHMNFIKPINDKPILVHWFNSHINTDYNWTFSFGIPKQQKPQESVEEMRKYFKEILKRDKTMIMSMKDTIVNRERKICEGGLI